MRYIRNEFSKVHDRDFKYEAEFRTIIVSSLRAIPNFRLSNLSAIIGNMIKTFVNLWAKRIGMDTFKDSFFQWIRTKSQIYKLMEDKNILKN
jgi:hypothetical protein